jgi:uncharacterized membrane protein
MVPAAASPGKRETEGEMDPYLLLKALHLLGVILFVGNIVVTGWWKTMADRTGDTRIIAFAQRQVTLTDWVFTLGGIVLIVASGTAAAAVGGFGIATPWIMLGSGLFIASGLVWIAILVPVQARLGRLAKGFAAGGAIPAEYWRLGRLWAVFGLLATVLPLGAVAVMVLKVG